MPVIGQSASFAASGAPTPGLVALQIPGSGFWALLAAPGVALLLGAGAPTPGAEWVGQSAAQTI